MKRIIFSLLILNACSPDSQTISKQLKQSSIINGQTVNATDKIASLVVGVFNTRSRFLCSGTIIASDIVLTAAHCIPGKAQELQIIFSTDVDRILKSKDQNILTKFMLPAIETKIFPKWNPRDEDTVVDTGDMALIRFKGELPSGYKAATFLNETESLKIGQIVTVAGFGVSDVDMEEINPRQYSKLDQAIESGEVICSAGKRDNYGICFELERSGDGVLRVAHAPVSFIHESEIRLNEKKAGTCNGDSGGPAFIEYNGEYLLLGVTSRGSELCNEAGFYTNAVVLRSWIEETIESMRH